MRTFLKILIIFLSIVLVLASALAIFIARQFRFPEGTVVCGTDISHMPVWIADDLIQEDLNGYTLNLTVAGTQNTLTAEDLSMRVNQEVLNQLAEEYEAGNPVMDGKIFLSVDVSPIQALLKQQIADDVVQPEDYRLQWNGDQSAFELLSGADGQYNNRDTALQTVMEGIRNLAPSITLTEADYRTTFTDPDKAAKAQQALESANELASYELTYTFYLRGGEETQEIIDSSTIASWLAIGPDGLSVTWDTTPIREYADTLADAYSIEGGEGYFMTHSGDEIKIPSALPTQLVDAQALYEDICAGLADPQEGVRLAPYTVLTGYKNFDGTYIEVSIPEQKLRAYLNGELFADTDIITGCAHCDHDTVTGAFKVQNHVRDVWLQEEYFVNYWMGFQIPKYGLHDADRWRAEYGGEIYKTNGSGGCINVPGEIISKMYTAFDNGTPVIIYDDSYKVNQEPTA